MRKIDLIVIHCSATRENTDYSPEQLESDHKARGFLRAGYNFYIRKSGEVVNLRPLEQIPAHARGHNKHSIGICYEGGLDITGQSRDTARLLGRWAPGALGGLKRRRDDLAG